MSAQKRPLVTIYLVNHNYVDYVAKAIDSVFVQTYRNIELLIIDDGSIDGSQREIERVLESWSDSPISVSKVFQENHGLTATNNIALSLASGIFIMRLDADDWLLEDAVEKLVAKLEGDSSNGLVFGDYFEVDPSGEVLGKIERHAIDELEILDMPAHGACTLFRTDCLRRLGGYDKEFDRQDGYEIWLRFIKLFGVTNIPEPIFYYRQHDTSLTKNEAKLLEVRSRILSKHGSASSDKEGADGYIFIPVSTNYGVGVKSLDPLGGKSLVSWTLDEACKSKRASNVILSCSDDRVIDYVAANYGSEVLLVRRPPAMAEMSSSISEALEHALGALNKTLKLEDIIAILAIENPFKRARHIDNLFDVMQIFDAERVVGVRREDRQVYRHGSKGLKNIVEEDRVRHERDEIYRKSGGLQAIRYSVLLNRDTKKTIKSAHYVVDEISDVEVRTNLGWQVAELLISSQDAGVCSFVD